MKGIRERLCCVLALLIAACSNKHDAVSPSSGASGSGASGSGASGSGASGSGASGASGSSSSGGTTANSGAPPIDAGPGDPGCGLSAVAFCDTFDAPSTKTGRAGELDVTKWSLGRGEPQLPTGKGLAFGVGIATLPTCRAGLPTGVFPDKDTLVCDPNAAIASNHLLVAVGAQNYGQNSYRIRQPFDFTDRTGIIAFDSEAFILNPLLGWVAFAITEDPTPVPGFAIGEAGTTNEEGTAVPRNALELHFNNQCAGSATPQFALGLVDVLNDYKDTIVSPTAVCVPAQQGHLNHFEIRVSKSHLDVYATPFSADGLSFAAQQLLYSGDIALPFSKGYVQISVHDHAAIKYSQDKSFGAQTPIDAWIARWDNVGFDGPINNDSREYEIPDSLVPGKEGWDIAAPVMSVGYTVADAAAGPSAVLHFQNVDLTGMTTARIALTAWYNYSQGKPADFTLQYRLNGGTFHSRPFTASELAVLTNGHSQGSISEMLDVPFAELVAGDNTLEFQAVNIPQAYPPAVANIDLILSKK